MDVNILRTNLSNKMKVKLLDKYEVEEEKKEDTGVEEKSQSASQRGRS